MLSFKNWAAGLAVAVLAAGCGGGGGGGGGSSTSQVVASVSPTSATLSATTTSLSAPSASLVLTATNVPDAGLYVGTSGGSKGYVTASFDGNNSIVVTGVNPASLAAGTYKDSVSVEVCYDSQCARQVSNSPLAIPVTYTITQGDPATATPGLVALSPASVVAGSAGFTLTISGINFNQTSQVLWNGQARATTYVSPTTLNVLVNASDIASMTTAYVTVSNTASGGGTSSGLQFQVTAPVPTITSLQPATAALGGSAYTLTVNGTGFDGYTQVMWNGGTRTTTYVSSTKVTAQISAADIALAGVVPVNVTEITGNVASNTMNVTIAAQPLALGSIVPSFVSANGPAYVETLIGTGFDATSVVQWNGVPRATTLVSTTQLKVQVSAADIASVGSASLQVVNTGAGAGTSVARTLTIGAPSTAATAFQVNPQHNGATRFASVLAPASWSTTPAWTAFLGGTASYPLIAGGRVFVTVNRSVGGTALVALSAATGQVLWGPIALSGAVNATYDNGRVMVVNGSGVMTGYDAATGNQLWVTQLPLQWSFSAPPTAANGMVYTGGAGDSGTLYALDDTSGAIVWTANVWNGDVSSPTVTADGVYVSYPCQTYDFAPQTGLLVWRNNGPCEGGGGATGTYANGVYYSPDGVGSASSVFDAETGTLLSSYAAGLPPALGATTGYFVQSGALDAIDLASKTILWTFADTSIVTSPILVNGYVFAANGAGKLYGIDAATGAIVWQTTLAAPVSTGNWMQLNQSGMSAGEGLLLVPNGNTLQAWTLSNNP
jgi:outer membrane protein assembly factor BamB